MDLVKIIGHFGQYSIDIGKYAITYISDTTVP